MRIVSTTVWVRVLLALLVSFSLMAAARPQALPRPDSRGDYTRNDGPVKAKSPSGSRSPGSLWRVVAPGLAGRTEPGLKGKIVMSFKQGTVLQADVGRGGSDEVLQNAVDGSGHTWMRVRTEDGKDLGCYVRANSRFIRPVTR
jgi:hypothetical protein